MNKLKAFLTVSIFVLLQAPVASVARAELTPQEAKQRWGQLSESDKQRLRENYRRWQAMPEARRNELKNNFQRFRSMSPDQRQRVVQNFKRFQQLSPEKRDQLKSRFQKFRQLPPEERRKRIDLWKKRMSDRRTQVNRPAARRDRPLFRR